MIEYYYCESAFNTIRPQNHYTNTMCVQYTSCVLEHKYTETRYSFLYTLSYDQYRR